MSISEGRIDKSGVFYLNGGTRILLGALGTIFMFGLALLTTNVIANQKESVREHVEIRSELKHGDDKVLDNVERIVSKMDARMDRIESKLDKIFTAVK